MNVLDGEESPQITWATGKYLKIQKFAKIQSNQKKSDRRNDGSGRG